MLSTASHFQSSPALDCIVLKPIVKGKNKKNNETGVTYEDILKEVNVLDENTNYDFEENSGYDVGVYMGMDD